MACRSAENWNTSTAARWHTHWPVAPASSKGRLGRSQLLVQAEQAPIAFVAPGGDLLQQYGTAHGAAGFLHVPAILEAAIDATPKDLDESALGRAHEARRRREIPNARCVDDGRVCIDGVSARRGGGVPTLFVAGQLGRFRRRLGGQGVDQGGLADAGL